jgi:hypothetical protein
MQSFENVRITHHPTRGNQSSSADHAPCSFFLFHNTNLLSAPSVGDMHSQHRHTTQVGFVVMASVCAICLLSIGRLLSNLLGVSTITGIAVGWALTMGAESMSFLFGKCGDEALSIALACFVLVPVLYIMGASVYLYLAPFLRRDLSLLASVAVPCFSVVYATRKSLCS